MLKYKTGGKQIMKLKNLEAKKIILGVLGERGKLKSEEELAEILKKRLTKKERQVLNSKLGGADTKTPDVVEEEFETIAQKAIKKIKNESVHREFYVEAKAI